MRTKTIALLLAAALCLGACSANDTPAPAEPAESAAPAEAASPAETPAETPAESPAWPLTFTDHSGEQVTLTQQPETVAVLFSSYVEVWQNAGGQVAVTVGESVDRGFVSEDCILVDEGNGQAAVDMERLIAAQPDLVIATADLPAQVEAVEQCRANGIPGALFHVETFDDYLDMLKICCDITGQADNFQRYGLEQQEKIQKLLAQVEELQDEKPQILFVRAGSSSKSTKAKTAEDNFVCVMLNELGTENIADKAPILLDGLSLEEVVAADPDYLFISTMGNPQVAKDYMESVLTQPGWNALSAVKAGNYSYLPKDLFHYKPNGRWYEAYRTLAQILYPEANFD